MKKILFTLIISLIISLISSSPVLSADKMQFMRDMAHANPVPNYMSILAKNADKLGLSSEQQSKVMAWKKKNGANMAAMVGSVIKGEQEIKSASMAGVSQDKIKAMADKLMDTRKKIIAGKTTCRDYMMNVLTDTQWQQLTDIIKAG